MFGFPFITSLVLVLAGVVVMSLLINKGLAKRANSTNTSNATLNKIQHTPTNRP